MAEAANRNTVDLSAYPDLVVIYLGMRVEEPRGVETLQKLRPQIDAAVAEGPEGLLLHERLTYGDDPPHVGMRQYWRDFDSLERWARSLPHQDWWKKFLRDTGGTGFWHEVYFMRGGMEAVYDTMKTELGFSAFAPVEPARGRLFSARGRAGVGGEETVPSPLSEEELYRS